QRHVDDAESLRLPCVQTLRIKHSDRSSSCSYNTTWQAVLTFPGGADSRGTAGHRAIGRPAGPPPDRAAARGRALTGTAPRSTVRERASALPARQLLAQSGERLVRGQRAGLVATLGGVRTATGRDRSGGLATLGSGLGVRLAGLDDLRLVLLEALLRLGVLALPLLALLLVALEPV